MTVTACCSLEVTGDSVAANGKLNGISFNTATSRAIPRTLKQSPRFGVIEISSTWLSSPRYSRTSIPTGASTGKINRPSTPSSMSISLPPHSIPCDSTPRSLPFLMANGLSSPGAGGNLAPINATGALIPTATFGAPHTICRVSPVPTSTVVTRNLSASGCWVTVNTSPTTTPLKSLATLVKSSSSRPAIVSCSPNCSAVNSGFAHWRSHFSLIFIVKSQFLTRLFKCFPLINFFCTERQHRKIFFSVAVYINLCITL